MTIELTQEEFDVIEGLIMNRSDELRVTAYERTLFPPEIRDVRILAGLAQKFDIGGAAPLPRINELGELQL